MTLASWLRKLIAGKRPPAMRPSPHRGKTSGRVSTRLWLERLEDRLAPAVSWNGLAGDGNWDTPGNWVGGALPGMNDDVTIANATVTHSSGVTDQIKSLALTSTILNLSGGTLDIVNAGALTSTTSTFNLSGGTLKDA